MYGRFHTIISVALVVALASALAASAAEVEVTIPFTSVGWHLIALPLEPVNKTILVDPETGEVDPDSIFYDSWQAGNSPSNRLFRIQPGVGYWAYVPQIYDFCWYYLGMECTTCEWCVDRPPSGPWWQGMWLLVDVPHTLTYTAHALPEETEYRCLDISSSPGDWAWMMMGACARVPDPYDPDVSTWPTTSLVHDTMWGKSASCGELPTEWWPTAVCPFGGANDAWDQRCIGLPLSGYLTGASYYTVSPPQAAYCAPPADTDSLKPGEGYWLDVEHKAAWVKLLADQWP